MTNMSIQPLWLTYFIESLLVLEFQLTKTYFGTFSYKAHFRPQISSNVNIEIWNHHHLHLQYVNTRTSSISSVWEYLNIIICILSRMQKYRISMCYDGTQGSLSSQLQLSHRIIVVSIFRSKRPDISFRSHMASQLSRAICCVFQFNRAKRNTGLFPAKP